MKRAWKNSVLVLTIATTAFAQTPWEALPNNYQLILENEWVRVVRVHYAPHEKVPIHDHTFAASAYLYLADGGPVRFQHFEPQQVSVVRPPVKLGGFRMYPAITERHAVENTSDLPSDFLRVEMKALSGASPSPHGRFPPPVLKAAENLEKVEFEDGNIRIVRSVCASHQACSGISSESAALEITFTPALLVQKGAKVDCQQMQAGQIRWLHSVDRMDVWNPGEVAWHSLRIEFKGAK